MTAAPFLRPGEPAADGRPGPPSLASLIEGHADFVYAAAMRQVGDPHLAADVTQAVFLILQDKLPSLNSETIMTAWLLRTTRYTCLASLHRERRRRHHERKAAAMRSETQVAVFPDDWPRIIDAALGRLSGADRAALAGVYFEGLSHKQVAERLGVSEGTAHKRVQRAVAKLRRVLRAREKREVSIAGIVGALAAVGKPAAAPAAVRTAITDSIGGNVSAEVSELVKGVVRMAKVLRMKSVAMVLAVGIAVVAGGALALREAWGAQGAGQPSVAVAAPIAASSPAGTAASNDPLPDILAKNGRAHDLARQQAFVYDLNFRQTFGGATGLSVDQPKAIAVSGREKVLGDYRWSDLKRNVLFAAGFTLPEHVREEYELRSVRNDHYFAEWGVNNTSANIWDHNGLENQNDASKRMDQNGRGIDWLTYGFDLYGVTLSEAWSKAKQQGGRWLVQEPRSDSAPFVIEDLRKDSTGKEYQKGRIVVDPQKGFLITGVDLYGPDGKRTARLKIEPRKYGNVWIASDVEMDSFNNGPEMPSLSLRATVTNVETPPTLPPETFETGSLNLPEGTHVVRELAGGKSELVVVRQGKLISTSEDRAIRESAEGAGR